MVYFLVYFIVLILTIINYKSNKNFYLAYILIIIFVGFRKEIGCDWDTYVNHLELTKFESIQSYLLIPENIYWILTWISKNIFDSILFINLVFSLIFAHGLIKFCKSQKYGWLALLLSFPYLILVVSMGYNNQGAAIGLCLLAYLKIEKRDIKGFLFLIIIACTIHTSSILMFPIGLVLLKKYKYISTIIFLLAIFFISGNFLEDQYSKYDYIYVQREYNSSGAYIRLLLSLLTSLILLKYKKYFNFSDDKYSLWKLVSLISIILFLALFFVPSTTAIDRIGLYFLPIQLVVFSNLTRFNRLLLPFMFYVIYTLMLFLVWYNFASHNVCWFPYKNFLFDL